MQLSDAADALGVHYQTAYGWVRQGALPARKTARGYEVSESDVRDLLAKRAAGVEPPRAVRVRDWAAQADRLYTALVAGNEAQALRDFGRLAAGVPLAGLCDQVIAPALRRVGSDWAAGELSIAAEHRATAICERLIGARARQPQGRPRGVAVTATPPGERHALPALMAAACLREDHWQVHHLAADLPVADVIGLAGDAGASLVVLSSATASAARLAGREAKEIRARLPHARVLAGRPGDTLARLRELARAPLPPTGGRPAATGFLVRRPGLADQPN
jgi:MerR family transcriptional regulator, light-induced transcriptional regulator